MAKDDAEETSGNATKASRKTSTNAKSASKSAPAPIARKASTPAAKKPTAKPAAAKPANPRTKSAATTKAAPKKVAPQKPATKGAAPTPKKVAAKTPTAKPSEKKPAPKVAAKTPIAKPSEKKPAPKKVAAKTPKSTSPKKTTPTAPERVIELDNKPGTHIDLESNDGAKSKSTRSTTKTRKKQSPSYEAEALEAVTIDAEPVISVEREIADWRSIYAEPKMEVDELQARNAELAEVEAHEAIVEEAAVNDHVILEPSVISLDAPATAAEIAPIEIDETTATESSIAQAKIEAELVAMLKADEARESGEVNEDVHPETEATLAAVSLLPVVVKKRRFTPLGAAAAAVATFAAGVVIGTVVGGAANDTALKPHNTAAVTPEATTTIAPPTMVEGDPSATTVTTADPTTLTTQANGPAAGPIAMKLSGSSSRQSALFSLPAGNTLVHYNTTGGSITVQLLKQSNDDTGDSFLCTNACDKNMVVAKDAGQYYLSVESQGGNWDVQVGGTQ